MTNRLTILAAVVIIVAPPLLALFALRIAREFDDLLGVGFGDPEADWDEGLT